MKLGCTSFSWKTKDNKHLLGRTYDQFGTLSDNKIVIIPKNYIINLENKESSVTCNSKYTLVGMGVMGSQTPIIVDGLNDKGLMGALLYYPDYAKYDTQLTEKSININPGYFITYILSQFSTIEEIASKIKNINLTNEDMFGEKMPLHYIFSDRTGETIIIEPDENGLSIHRKTMGVMTNSPDYNWHKQNLKNYSWVTNEAKGPQVICGQEYPEYEITGMVMPGDYSSPSRFIRVALMKNFAPLAENEIDGVTRMLHSFSTVDIPEGVKTVRVPEGEFKGNYYEKTLCMSVVCSESLTYYYTLATNRRICAIKLENIAQNSEIQYFELQEKQDILFLT